MKSGQGRYYQELAREDYYLEGGEPPGLWLGGGAKALGCFGTVKADELSAFFRGFAVDGEPLVQNAGKENRQCGWDLTFSAPKSVSVLWSQLSEEQQLILRECQAEAVKSAVEFLEENFAFSRVGRSGADQVKAGLVIAAFEHSTSRALDPQLHTHCLVFNLGVDDKGQVRSILSKPFYTAKMLAGAYYRAELAWQLQQRLGVTIERPLQASGKQATWFEVVGVAKDILNHFSKRRTAIEKELGERGLESASAAAFAALSTRNAKTIVPPRKELHARWKAEGQALGFTPEILASILGVTRAQLPERQTKAILTEAIALAVDDITFGENSFTANELTRRTLEGMQGNGISASDVVSEVKETLKGSPFIVSLGVRNSEERFTTQDVLKEEQEFFKATETLRGRASRPVAKEHVVAANERMRGTGDNRYQLDGEQQAAVRYITQGKGSIKVVSGFAGTGKTDMLSAAKEALEKGGYRVIGTALSGVAARTLEHNTGINSETVRKREYQLADPSLSDTLNHHARQLGRAALGKQTWKIPKLNIDERTVLVIDEAGMLGTRDFAMLAKAVVGGGGSIIAVGDDRQLSSIERGGGFKHLIETLGGAKLSEIRRQRDELDRQAVKDVVAGNPKEALTHYAKKGQFFVADKHQEVAEQLVKDWAQNGGVDSPDKHHIFCSTRAEVARLNALAQRERLQAGKLDASQSIEQEGQKFMVGDQVRFNIAAKTRGIQKGESGTVIACQEGFSGKYVAVARNSEVLSWSEYALQTMKHHATQLVNAASGKATTPPPPRHDIVLVPLATSMPFAKPYRGLSLDYAKTTHLGQGQTVENSYVLLGGNMTDRELSYVQMSRHKDRLHLYSSEQHAGKELSELARRHRRDGNVEQHAIDQDLPDYSTLVARMQQSHVKELATSPAAFSQEQRHGQAKQHQQR